MLNRYYRLPIDFKTLTGRKEKEDGDEDEEAEKEQERGRNWAKVKSVNHELPTCDLRQSIAQNIFLIITSKHRENRFDDSYGCEIWDMDFELISNENSWLETVRRSIDVSVARHEPRLYDVSVDVDVTLDEQVVTLRSTKTVKKRVRIIVKGRINENGEPFYFDTNIYISPLSLD